MSGKIGDNVYRASGVVATAAAAAGGVSWQAVETGATFTAVAGNGYPVNTTAQACTVTLPASASVGDEIIFTDYARKWALNALTINPNSLNYQGNSSPNPVYDTAGESIHIVYQDATKGWIPTYDGAVALETAQTYTSDWLIIAGGGGAGNGYGGGGGGGGYRSSYDSEASGADSPAEPNITLTESNVYTVTVGAGGAGTAGTDTNGVTGDDSSLIGTGVSITSAGGGGGMYTTGGDPGQAGGSGGGAQSPGSGGAGTATQGKDGGDSSSPAGHGGTGGGGATVEPPTHTGGVGTPGQDGIDGGDGQTSTIIGASTVYAGGGGGAGYWWASRGVGGDGGDGGGGDGGDTHNPAVGPSAPNEPDPGIANRGGGGGSGYEAGSGGSGAVILRVADADYSGNTTGTPTVATDVGGSGETTILFTAPGTYTA